MLFFFGYEKKHCSQESVGEGHVNTDWLQKSCKNKLICKAGYESQMCYYSALQHLYLHCKMTVIIAVLELIK